MVLHKNLTEAALDLHEPKDHTHLEAEITDLNHFDPDAIHTNVADEIHAAFPIALIALDETDSFIIEVDDGGTWSKARLQWNTIKTLLESQIGGPWLPLTAGGGEPISGALHLEDDLHLDANQKIYGASGHIMAWYQSADDSMNFGTNGDILRLKGSALRPVYEQTPGVDVEIALLSDIGAGGGASVLRDGSLGLTADWDAGVYKITTENLDIGDTIQVNTINELTPAAGVTIESVQFDDYDGSQGSLTQVRDITLTGAIIRGDATLFIDSVRFMDDGDVKIPDGKAIQMDVFAESTTDAGVTNLTDMHGSPGKTWYPYALEGHNDGDLGMSHSATLIATIISDALLIDDGMSLDTNKIDTNGDNDLVIYRDETPKITLGANSIEFQTGPIKVNGGLGSDLQVWDGAAWAGAVYMNGATAMEFCDTDHECKFFGSEFRPVYHADGELDKDLALLDDMTTALPIFHSLGYYSCASGGGTDYIEWQDDIRKDTGYTHDEVTNNDEIELDEDGWYKITLDCGVEVNSLESEGEMAIQMEYHDGFSWDDENGWRMKFTTNAGSAGENAQGTMTVLYQFSAGDKIRFEIEAGSGFSYTASTDNDYTRVTIERVWGT